MPDTPKNQTANNQNPSSTQPQLAVAEEEVEQRRFKHTPPEGLVPGTMDALPDRMQYVDWVLFQAESIAITHELKRVQTPVLEKVANLSRGLGAETDSIEDQLFRVTGKSGDAVALRPDHRTGLARAFAQDKFSRQDKPVRLWTHGAIFRVVPLGHGALREMLSFGFELIGEKNAVLDAQLIQMAHKIIKRLGLADVVIQVNTVGCLDCRPEYIQQLKEFYESRDNALCKKCRKRRTSNPMLLLTCKEEKCERIAKDAPQIIDHLCETCHKHFTETLEFLDDLEIPYSLNPQLVPEIEYYARTVFSVVTEKTDRPRVLFEGGRYDDLIEKMGGRPTPAVGITGFVDNLVLALQEQAIKIANPRKADVYLAQLSAMAKKKALSVFEMLREGGIRVVEGFGKNAITTQIEQATKLNVPITLILGQKEAMDETIIMRDMVNGVQEIVPLARLVTELKKRIQ
ncbi:MAG: histidine--tRNA ligase [bacterium]|nr:histidine--tRNA ligase [bacterium]